MSAFPKTIAQARDALLSKKVSPTELTREFLARAQKNPQNAWITVCEERALAQAKQADAVLARDGAQALAKQPLLGMPLGIKDVLTMDGVRTTCGSKMLDRYIPPYTATAVERLERAGAISVGKLNMDEFAMGGSNENSAYGSVKHPMSPSHVPGGSSGGSAAAVGAQQCLASLGTDTGGSIRLPASFCGIVGFKPSYGRISRSGLIAFASSLDQIGPMTWTVQDAALLTDVMSGHDPMDSTSSPRAPTRAVAALASPPQIKGLKIGVPQEYWSDGLQADVKTAVQNAIDGFKKQGAEIVEISLPNTPYCVAVYYIVAVSEASSNLARFDGVRFGARPPTAESATNLEEFYTSVRSLFGPEVKRRIILGTFALSAGYADAYYTKACLVRRMIQKDFDAAFSKVDVIMGPVSPTTAFKLGDHSRNPLQMYLNDIYTIPANLVGLPGISVPCGKAADGMPIGLQIMGRAMDDERVLALGQAWEKMSGGGVQ